MAGKITREVLEGYLECKYKGRLRLAGEHREESDYLRMIAEEEAEARTRGLAHLLSCHPDGEACQGEALTFSALGRGAPLFLDATLEDGQVSLRFGAIARVAGASRLGDFHYAPVLCCAGPTIRRQTRDLLAVLGLVLGTLQGRQPATGLAIRGPECRRTRVKLTAKLNRRAGDTLAALKQLQAGGKAPVLTLNDHCPTCEFRRRCHAEAVGKDDLSLLRVMSEAELRKQRGKGIFTVTQLAYTFRPRRKGKRARGEGQPHHAALQALAIRDAKTYILGKPEVPDRPTRVYLDLEGDAKAGSVYLLGALVVKDGAAAMHSFWADDASGEDRLFRQLLEVLDGEDYALFHFSSYERKFLKRMRRAARRKGPADRLLASAIDVLSLVRSNVYFPVHANGLKDIARHLGFAWAHPDASGLQSLVWRRRWEQTRDDSLKQRLAAYNAEDCAALRLVTEHLGAIAANFDRQGGGEGTGGVGAVELVQASKRGSDFRKWGPHLLPAAGVRAAQQVRLVRLPAGEGRRPQGRSDGPVPAGPPEEGQGAEADQAGRGAGQPLPRLQGPQRLPGQEPPARQVRPGPEGVGGRRQEGRDQVRRGQVPLPGLRPVLPAQEVQEAAALRPRPEVLDAVPARRQPDLLQEPLPDVQGVLRPDHRLQRPAPVQGRVGTPLQGDLRRSAQEDRGGQPAPRRRDGGSVQEGQGLRLGLHQPGERGLHVQG
jgi:predicted RecB family nuclease